MTERSNVPEQLAEAYYHGPTIIYDDTPMVKKSYEECPNFGKVLYLVPITPANSLANCPLCDQQLNLASTDILRPLGLPSEKKI